MAQYRSLTMQSQGVLVGHECQRFRVACVLKMPTDSWRAPAYWIDFSFRAPTLIAKIDVTSNILTHLVNDLHRGKNRQIGEYCNVFVNYRWKMNIVIYAFSMLSPCILYVFSMHPLCLVYAFPVLFWAFSMPPLCLVCFTMPSLCLLHACCMPSLSFPCTLSMHSLCILYVFSLPSLCLGCAFSLPSLCLFYASSLLSFCFLMPSLCFRNAFSIPSLCLLDASSLPYLCVLLSLIHI